MRTTKPIATISFNTPAYLRLKLSELTSAKRISFWAFILHKPEDDEAGLKEHIHLYIEPSKMLQTDDLRNDLKEYDPEHPAKPRGTLTFGSSKFADWYLYGLHDRRYLAMKGQSRRFHYSHEEIISSDADDLLCKARSIDLLSLSPYADMQDAKNAGFTFQEYFNRGTVPIAQIRQFSQAWDLLSSTHTDRSGRPGHPNDLDVDPDTGEIK